MDMDGVLWRGDQPLAGLTEFVAFLRQKQLPFMLATNNSSKQPTEYVTKLAKMGVDAVAPEQIITSGTATAAYLRGHYPEGSRVYVVGMDGLRRILSSAGFVVVGDDDTADVTAVVCGIDFELSYATMRRAALLIRSGADFIGTNPDRTFPTPEGLVPGAGSLLAMLSAATDCEPVIIGKPERAMFSAALDQLAVEPATVLMIGDRLNTDIQGGRIAGLQTALVLTGVSTRDEVAVSDIQPDTIAENLLDLMTRWSDETS